MAVAESLAGKKCNSFKAIFGRFRQKNPTFFASQGGVAANMKIREMLEKVAASVNVTFSCATTGAMYR